MRIAVHDYAGFTFPLELSRALSERGHRVMHLFTQASGGPKASFEERQAKRLRIVNVDMQDVDKDHFLKRWMQEHRYGGMVINELHRWRPDLIISGNTPLEAQRKIVDWAEMRSIPSVFWLHDLLSIAARSIVSRFNRVLGFCVYYYLNQIEIRSLQKANHIVSIAEDFVPILNGWQIAAQKISVIPNWAPIEQISVLPRKNCFSESYGLNDKFILLYAGTLGKKQDIRLIADLAIELSKHNKTKFVVATDDRGHRLLDQAIAQSHCANLLRLPLQSASRYPYLLASADATLVTLESSAGLYCVPSKLWAAYCAQRPTIVAVDEHNLCARITKSINAGIVISPGALDECIEAIRRLNSNRSLCVAMGKNARHYAETHFPIDHIADQFETIIDRIMSRHGGVKHIHSMAPT